MKKKLSILLLLPLAFSIQASAQIKQSTILKQGLPVAAPINKIVSIEVSLDSTTNSGANQMGHYKAVVKSIGPGPVQYVWVATAYNQPQAIRKGNFTPGGTGIDIILYDKPIMTHNVWHLMLKTLSPTQEESNLLSL